MYAEYKVYIDGARWDGVSREAGFVRHLQIGNDLNALKEEIRKYDIRAFAIPLLPAQDGIVLPHYYLSSDPEWRLAYVDDASILFVSRDEAQDKEAQSTAL